MSASTATSFALSPGPAGLPRGLQRGSEVFCPRRDRSAPRWTGSAVVEELTSGAELREAVGRPGTVSVVSVVTRGCRACIYAGRQYARAARELGASGRVHFFQLDAERPALAAVCRRLRFDSVPMWQLFVTDESGAVFAIDRIVGPRNVGRLRESVKDLIEHGFDPDLYEVDTERASTVF